MQVEYIFSSVRRKENTERKHKELTITEIIHIQREARESLHEQHL